jgi:probable DNA metabolism protein
MHHVTIIRDFDAWRTTARDLLARNVPPEHAWWEEIDAAQPFLLATAPAPSQPSPGSSSPGPTTASVPKEFLPLARRVACHRDPARWPLLYRTLWRLTHDERHLLANPLDDDTRALEALDKSVRRDAHKMTAFVRFRRVDQNGEEHYVAYHRPDHYIVRVTADFFVRRFGAMRWSILTPDDCAHWDGQHLSFTPGVDRSQAPSGDDLERLWSTYYANIFNPARIKLAAMKKEMPVRYWDNLPETQLIPELLKDAPRRVEVMMARKLDEYPTAEAFMPAKITLNTLKESAAGCQGCPLYKTGTQTVFGEGAKTSKIIMVGEQPGDQEDRAGKPFVGPAGQMLDTALEEVGIDRNDVYVTNTVKHFKWEPRGTRRIHAKPNAREIQACKPWLTAELQVLKPQMVVCLGATAAQALMGKEFRITKSRGEIFRDTPFAPWLMATVHPSSILRTPSEDREAAYRAFVEDLRIAAQELASAK